MNIERLILCDYYMINGRVAHTSLIINEMYYGYEKEYTSFEEFSKAVAEYIDYYNNKRIQAKTKWMPPVQYRIASMCSA